MQKNRKTAIIMRKIQILTLTLLISFSAFNTKAQTFAKGTTVANVGMGFGWYNYGYNIISLPAISFSLEKGIYDISDLGTISIGAIGGWKHASYIDNFYRTTTYKQRWNWNDYIVAGRCALHFTALKIDKTDLYGGIALGLRIESAHYRDEYLNYNSTSSSINPLFSVYAGGRYYFTEKLALYGEVGYGLGYLTIGASYKLK